MFDGPLTAELDPGERRARLRLARSARIGPVTFHEALAHFGSARDACVRLATVGDGVIDREEGALKYRSPDGTLGEIVGLGRYKKKHMSEK